uniref:Uncharacterized protein MANES_09G106600 n=1 Tax=Rhizophora mucronata TaxID=61149 RepID=A0A2P2JEP3_RHIMU
MTMPMRQVRLSFLSRMLLSLLWLHRPPWLQQEHLPFLYPQFYHPPHSTSP